MAIHPPRALRFFFLMLLAVLLSQGWMSSVGSACSMVITSLHIRANYYLVRDTPLIVLVRTPEKPLQSPSPPPLRGLWAGHSSSSDMIDMQIVAVIKGQLPQPTLTLSGSLRHQRTDSDEADFQQERKATIFPDCTFSRSFQYGKLYLLFLEPVVQTASKPGRLFHKRAPVNWQLVNDGSGRVEEEVASPTSPWVVAVQHYLRIAALKDPVKELEALRSLRSAAVQTPSQDIPAGLVADIDMALSDQRSGLTTDDVIAIARAFSGNRDHLLWELAGREELAAGPYILETLQSGLPEDGWQPVHTYIRATKDRRLLPFFDERFASLSRSARWDLLNTLLCVYGPQDRSTMLSLLDRCNSEEVGLLLKWFARYPASEPQEKLTRYVKMSGDVDPSLGELAAAGEPSTLAWALGQLNNEPLVDKRVIEILALSPLPEAGAEVCRRVVTDHAFLKETLNRYMLSYYRRWDRIACIANVDDLTAEERARIQGWLLEGKNEQVPEAIQLLSQPEWQGQNKQ